MLHTSVENCVSDNQRREAAKIIAAVQRSRAHEAAEIALTDAKRRRSEIASEIRTLNGQPRGPADGGRIERQLVALDREERQLRDVTIPPLRQQVLTGREIHGNAIRSACMPTISKAAAEARDALCKAQQALETLNYINDQIYRAGGTPMIIPVGDFDDQISRLARIAEWE